LVIQIPPKFCSNFGGKGQSFYARGAFLINLLSEREETLQ
jgi:hypothetical protein